MLQTFLKAKIHRIPVTSCDVNYEGSISISRELLNLTGIQVYEQVHVWDVTNGSRFITYAIEGLPGQIQVNGSAAHLTDPGHILIIAAFVQLEKSEIADHRIPKVLCSINPDGTVNHTVEYAAI